MTISPDALFELIGVGIIALIGGYFGTIKWIAKIDKDKVSHDICNQRRKECPCSEKLDKLETKLEKTEANLQTQGKEENEKIDKITDIALGNHRPRRMRRRVKQS